MKLFYTSLLIGNLLFVFLNYYLSTTSSGFWKHFALFAALFNATGVITCLAKLVF